VLLSIFYRDLCSQDEMSKNEDCESEQREPESLSDEELFWIVHSTDPVSAEIYSEYRRRFSAENE
jgi:hypothetical protein